MTNQIETYLYFDNTIFSMTKDTDFVDRVCITFEWKEAQTIQGDAIIFWMQKNGPVIEELHNDSGVKLFRYLTMRNGLGDKLPTAIRNSKGKVIYIS